MPEGFSGANEPNKPNRQFIRCHHRHGFPQHFPLQRRIFQIFLPASPTSFDLNYLPLLPLPSISGYQNHRPSILSFRENAFCLFPERK